jgi:competence protein ComEA
VPRLWSGAMQEIPRGQLALYALAIVAVALIGARYLHDQGARGEGAARASSPAGRIRLERSPSAEAYVYVTGAVRHPGVYRLPSWARLDQAVRRAGGPARGADLDGVNLAAKIADGQQVLVPRKGAAAAGATVDAEAGSGGPQAPISLNTATPEQLDQLDGVGPATAQKILAWRKEHGGFRSIDDLKQIGGIGPKRFEALKDKVRV